MDDDIRRWQRQIADLDPKIEKSEKELLNLENLLEQMNGGNVDTKDDQWVDVSKFPHVELVKGPHLKVIEEIIEKYNTSRQRNTPHRIAVSRLRGTIAQKKKKASQYRTAQIDANNKSVYGHNNKL